MKDPVLCLLCLPMDKIITGSVLEDGIEQDLLFRHLGMIDLRHDLQKPLGVFSVVGKQNDLVDRTWKDKEVTSKIINCFLQNPRIQNDCGPRKFDSY